MRLAIVGAGEFGRSVLRRVTRPDRVITEVYAPTVDDELAVAASAWGIPARTSVMLNVAEGLAPWELRDCDLLICAGHRERVPAGIFDQPTHAAIGYHPSLLPLHRGRDAIKWAIAHGDKVTGGTVYQLTEDLDRGPIYQQRHVFIHPEDTPQKLWARHLAPLGVRLLDSTIDMIDSGIRPRPQVNVPGSWEPRYVSAEQTLRAMIR